MRLRITLTLFALLALALFLAGSVSLLLVRHAQSDSSQQTLLRQAQALAQSPNLVTLPNLKLIKTIAGFSSIGPTVIEDGHVTELPTNVPLSANNLADLLHGRATVAAHNHVALAIAPLRYGSITSGGTHHVLALYLEAPLNFSADNILYFFLAGSVSLVVAAGVASAVSQRITRRVGAVALAARQIATGDLAVRLEGQRGRTYPELRELDASINTMAADLERAQQGERDFLLAISHEFRTPLTSIRGYAEAITEGAVDDPARAAGVVVSEAERLDRLIGDLLDLARLRARQFALDLAEIDIVGVCRQSCEALRLSFESSDLTLDCELPEETIAVTADYHRLSQVIANLLENAGKFAKRRVVLQVRGDSERVRVSVVDDGPGIAPEDLPFIFERLFKSDRHPGRTSGSGLGLAIVAELADAMHARVIAHSPLGDAGGTEMILEFRRGGRAFEE